MENNNPPSNVVPFVRRGWCAFCHSAVCTCTPATLKQQVAALMAALKEKNDQIVLQKTDILSLKTDLARSRIGLIKISFEYPNATPLKQLNNAGDVEEVPLQKYINDLLNGMSSL